VACASIRVRHRRIGFGIGFVFRDLFEIPDDIGFVPQKFVLLPPEGVPTTSLRDSTVNTLPHFTVKVNRDFRY
jgi:hypothetical protein